MAWVVIHFIAVDLDLLDLVAGLVKTLLWSLPPAGCYVLDTLTLVSLIFSAAPIIYWPSDDQPDHHLFCCFCVCFFFLSPLPLWHPAPLHSQKDEDTKGG